MRIAGTDETTGLPDKVFFSTALLPQLISKASADGDFLGYIMIALTDSEKSTKNTVAGEETSSSQECPSSSRPT